MNEPVPNVHFTSPGAKQVWPNRADCWSPAIPAIGRSRPQNDLGSVRPITPQVGTISGSASIGTPNRLHISGDHSPVDRSISNVRDAFETSVTCHMPRVIRAIRY